MNANSTIDTAADKAKGAVSNAAQGAKSGIDAAADKAKGAVNGTKQAASSTAETAKDKAAGVAETVKTTVQDTADAVRERTAEVADTVRSEADRIYREGEKRVSDAAQRAGECYEDLSEMTRRQPGAALGIAAGVGFLVGLVLSSRR